MLNKYLPMQTLGPSPKGMYVHCLILSLFLSLNLSGSKRCGSEKYLGSHWRPVKAT